MRSISKLTLSSRAQATRGCESEGQMTGFRTGSKRSGAPHTQSLPPATDTCRGNPAWQASFVNRRIRDAEDYKNDPTYIWENPVRAGLSERPGAICLVIGISGVGMGRPATRAKALNCYTGTFSRV